MQLAAATNEYYRTHTRIYEIGRFVYYRHYAYILYAHSLFYTLFRLMQLSKSHNHFVQIMIKFEFFIIATAFICILFKLENCYSIYRNKKIVTGSFFGAANFYEKWLRCDDEQRLWLMFCCGPCFCTFPFFSMFFSFHLHTIEFLLALIWLSHLIACRWNKTKWNETKWCTHCESKSSSLWCDMVFLFFPFLFCASINFSHVRQTGFCISFLFDRML